MQIKISQVINLVKKFSLLILLGLTISSTAADEQNQIPADAYDPLEKINRKIFIINSALDYVILRPIAVGYTKIVPAPFANKIENFIENFFKIFVMRY